MPVNTTIKIRKGTESEWQNSNSILASGEPGYEINTGRLKIGNGITAWNSLPYSYITPSGFVAGTGISLNLGSNSGSLTINTNNIPTSAISGFNSAVSGLLPVTNILSGYDINITNNSGVYTVASTNLVHVDSQQPQGFVNRTDSRISVSGNIFRIEPTGSSYSYYNKGIKVVKTSGDSLTIPNLTQINYIHFDTINNQISNKTTGFDFSTDIPIAYIAWNSGVGPSGQMTFFAEERHGIVMDTSTHKWIHYTFGAQYVGGLSIGNYVLDGDGSSNSHATISIGNGTLYQEDIEINITDSSSTDPFCQELSPIAQIPVYYHQGTTGQWVKNTATDYPVKYGANGPQYNLLTGGNWTTPDVSPGGATRYFAVWILATNQIDDPIISIMGQRIDSNQGSAESNNSWSDVNLTNLPLSEVKPLYRLIFAGDSDYTNVPKCRLLSILDIRVAVISTIAGVTQNDHGSLFGLGDDDHLQYLHVDNNRTVNAIHTFENGLTSNGLINSTSGNFTSLTINGTGVSVSGHSHTVSQITDFNEAVDDRIGSGLFVAGTGINLSYNDAGNSFTVSVTGLVNNPTNNRILTSRDNTTTGIDAETNLTFSDGTLTIGSTGNVSSSQIHLYNNDALDSVVSLRLFNTNNDAMVSIDSNDDSDTNEIYSFIYPLFIYSAGGPFTLYTNDNLDIYAPSGTTLTGGNLRISNQTANTIASFDANKNVTSLATGTYPSLTELSYVKGVTSAIQTQLNSKQNTLTNPVTGTGIASHVAYWNSSSGIVADSGQLYWDSTNNRLGIGTGSPTYGLHLVGSGYVNGFLDIDNLRLDANTISSTNSNGNIVITPSGSGALQRDTGGNTRGSYAVDWQTDRVDNNQVASGPYSVICGGDQNSAQGTNSTVIGGDSNTASATYSSVIGGSRSVSSKYGELSHAAGRFSTDGDAQHSILIARRETTDATANQVLFLDGNSERLTIPAGTTWTFSIKLSAYNNTDNEGGWWIFRGGIRRNQISGTTLIGSIITENNVESSLSAASASVVADDTNEALEIRVTGVASKSIRWVATVDISQVVAPTSLLLDSYGSALAAYSLRQLRTAYTGPVIRVRRSSDNAESDFYQNDIINGTLLTWVGGGNGFVKTWYDQSGNGLHATQSSNSLQPDIVISGALVNVNGRPSVNWTATTGKALITPATVPVATALSFSIIGAGAPNSDYNKVLQIGTESETSGFVVAPFANVDDWDWLAGYSVTFGNGYASGRAPRVITSSALFPSNINTQRDVFGVLSSTATQVFSNNSESTYYVRSTGNVNYASNCPLCIGNGLSTNTTPTAQQWYGRMQEIVIWSSNRSSDRAAIRSILRSYYSLP